MRRDTEPAMLWALGFLARSLDALAERLGAAAWVTRAVFNRLARELALLEAAARRAVLLMALVQAAAGAVSLDPPARPVRVPGPRGVRRPAAAPGAPGLALLEPLADPPLPEAAPWWQALSPSPAPKPAAPLYRRIAALSALLDDPEGPARRMAGLIARMRAGRLSRTHPLDPAGPARQGGVSGGLLAATARDLHARSLAALDALGP